MVSERSGCLSQLAYEPSLDQAGHATGPFSALVNVSPSTIFYVHYVVMSYSRSQATLANIDVFARDLHNSLLARNLSQIVDVIFVSDHGMADTSEVEWIYLDGDDILGTSLSSGNHVLSHQVKLG